MLSCLMSKKTYSISLFILLSSLPSFSCAHEGHGHGHAESVTAPDGVQKHDASLDDKAEKLQPFNINEEELKAVVQKILNEYFKEVLQKRQEMLALLPEETQNLVINANEMYEGLVTNANIGNNLIMVCEKVRTTLPVVQKDGLITQEQYDACAKGLEAFHGALITGAFTDLLKGVSKGDANPLFVTPMNFENILSPTADMFKDQHDVIEAFDEKDIAALRDQMVPVLKGTENNSEYAELRSHLILLQRIFIAVQDKKSEDVTEALFTYLKPLFEETSKKLQVACEKLDKEVQGLSASSSLELKKALEFWRREIQKHAKSLVVFASLKDSAEHTNYHTLFKLIAYSYDICHDFLDLYKRDNSHYGFCSSKLLVPNLVDYAFRSSMAVWHFFNMKSDLTKGVVFNTMLGTTKISSMSSMQLLMYNAMVAPLAMPVLLKPSFWYKRPHALVQAYSKIVTSWIYYHLFHCYLFGQDKNIVWPKDYNHLKQAVLFAARETNKVFFELIHLKIREKSDPVLLEKLEHGTWGIVKPEMIGFMADTLLPLLFIKKAPFFGEIIHADRSDVYGPTFGGADGVYVEQRVIAYVMASVGNHWGKILANKYQKQLGQSFDWGLGFVTDFLEIIHVLDAKEAETFHEVKDEVIFDLREQVSLIKELLRGVFVPENFARKWVVSLLTEHGHVDKTETDHTVIDQQIIYFVLSELAQYKLVSHLEAATLLRKYHADPSAIDEIVSKTVDALAGNLIGFGGGFAGSCLMSTLGSLLASGYGPFYPKIAKLFSSSSASMPAGVAAS